MPSSTSINPLATQTLNQADFLKLLVTQMSSQDPLNPQSDTAFAAQLAQFSSLQATQTMGGNLQTIQATGLIGQTVALTPSGGGNPVSGVVTGVQISSGTPQIVVNGKSYNLNQILLVTPTVTAATPTAPPSTPPATTTPTTTNWNNSISRNTNNS
jgi:flagellar basal-body rod modification protein FlgD